MVGNLSVLPPHQDAPLKTPEGIEVWPLSTFLRSVENARLWP